MQKIKKIVIITVALISFFSFLPNYPIHHCNAEVGGTSGNVGGKTPAFTKPSTVKIDNPTGSSVDFDVNVFIGNMINYLMGIIGTLFLLFFIYGGVTWMTAAGNSEKVAKAKTILIWNVLGAVMIFSSYAIVKFILSTLQNAA